MEMIACDVCLAQVGITSWLDQGWIRVTAGIPFGLQLPLDGDFCSLGCVLYWYRQVEQRLHQIGIEAGSPSLHHAITAGSFGRHVATGSNSPSDHVRQLPQGTGSSEELVDLGQSPSQGTDDRAILLENMLQHEPLAPTGQAEIIYNEVPRSLRTTIIDEGWPEHITIHVHQPRVYLERSYVNRLLRAVQQVPQVSSDVRDLPDLGSIEGIVGRSGDHIHRVYQIREEDKPTDIEQGGWPAVVAFSNFLRNDNPERYLHSPYVEHLVHEAFRQGSRAAQTPLPNWTRGEPSTGPELNPVQETHVRGDVFFNQENLPRRLYDRLVDGRWPQHINIFCNDTGVQKSYVEQHRQDYRIIRSFIRRFAQALPSLSDHADIYAHETPNLPLHPGRIGPNQIWFHLRGENHPPEDRDYYDTDRFYIDRSFVYQILDDLRRETYDAIDRDSHQTTTPMDESTTDGNPERSRVWRQYEIPSSVYQQFDEDGWPEEIVVPSNIRDTQSQGYIHNRLYAESLDAQARLLDQVQEVLHASEQYDSRIREALGLDLRDPDIDVVEAIRNLVVATHQEGNGEINLQWHISQAISGLLFAYNQMQETISARPVLQCPQNNPLHFALARYISEHSGDDSLRHGWPPEIQINNTGGRPVAYIHEYDVGGLVRFAVERDRRHQRQLNESQFGTHSMIDLTELPDRLQQNIIATDWPDFLEVRVYDENRDWRIEQYGRIIRPQDHESSDQRAAYAGQMVAYLQPDAEYPDRDYTAAVEHVRLLTRLYAHLCRLWGIDPTVNPVLNLQRILEAHDAAHGHQTMVYTMFGTTIPAGLRETIANETWPAILEVRVPQPSGDRVCRYYRYPGP